MPSTQRYIFPPNSIEVAVKALGIYETRLGGHIRAVYTRQQDGDWRYCVGRCVLGKDADDLREVYQSFAFISRTLSEVTIRELLQSLTDDSGVKVAPDFPPLRLAAQPAQNWREEIVPSHAIASRIPLRRYRVALETNPIFANDQLVDYELPYRPSAEGYVKEFLGLGPREAVDRGEFTIDVPEKRGAIRISNGRLSIAYHDTPLHLVGHINKSSINLKDNDVAEIQVELFDNIELWLLATGGDLVDYISTTHYPYPYVGRPREAEQEQRYLELIAGGESETCEFKPYIDLAGEKASDLEKTVCAFSNQRGGTLFVGVTDEGDVVGLARELGKRPEDLEKATGEYEKAIGKRLRESLKDNQCFTSRVVTVSGTRIIVVEVEKSTEVNFLVKSDLAHMAYIRHGATSAKLKPPEMKAMIEATVAQHRDILNSSSYNLTDMAETLSRPQTSISRASVLQMLNLAGINSAGITRCEGALSATMIILISAGWLPQFIGPSRGCLALMSGIITRMPA